MTTTESVSVPTTNEVSVPFEEVEVSSTEVAPVESITESIEVKAPVSSQVSNKILKQVEFYFSDANLPRDRFLQEELKKNDEGWIALSVIASFKRMQSLSDDLEVIAAAVEASSLLEVSEDKLFIRRKVALPEHSTDNMKTTLMIRGFSTDCTLEQLEEFFAGIVSNGSDGISAIRLRRHPKTKAFKGSVFLHLNSEEETLRIAEMKTLVHGGESIEVLGMTAFLEEQNAKHLARSSNKSGESSGDNTEVVPLTIEDVKKMVLTITGCPTDLDHRLMRTILSTKGPVAFVENVIPEGFSVVRFKEPCAADLILSITTEGGIRLPGIELALQVREPTDAEVEAFFVKMQEFKAKAALGGNSKQRNYHNKNKRIRRA